MTIDQTTIANTFTKLQQQRPVIHNITNLVVMQQTANALLALHCAPIMAHACEELQDITMLADALVINMGTIDAIWLNAMRQSVTVANQQKRPIILDPVGVGASRYRTEAALALLAHGQFDVICANSAEILALAGQSISSRGVDSDYQSDIAIEACHTLADKYHCIIVVSGENDLIISPNQQHIIHNGSPLMRHITGMGCTATAIIAACCAIEKNHQLSATTAMAIMGICGEMAASNCQGPGSFIAAFLDHLYLLTPNVIKKRLRLNEYAITPK